MVRNLIRYKRPYNELMSNINFFIKYPSPHDVSEFYMVKTFMVLLGEEGFNYSFKPLFDDAIVKEKTFEEFFEEYHKSMRQTDFYGDNTNLLSKVSSSLDTLLWNFIHITPVFYKVFEFTFVDDNMVN